MCKKNILTIVAVAMVVVLTATSANAALLVHEPFAYADGWLNGQGGGWWSNSR